MRNTSRPVRNCFILPKNADEESLGIEGGIGSINLNPFVKGLDADLNAVKVCRLS